MKSERLLYALTGARDDFVEQASPGQPRPARAWLKYAAAAACLCAVLAGALALGTNRSGPDAPDGLPLIDLPELGAGTMGYEGYLYYDASEIENGNPWREDMAFETMPVFKNGAYDPSGAGFPRGLDEDEIMRLLEKTARSLGTRVLETETQKESGAVYYIAARTGRATLRAYANGDIGFDLWSKYPWNLEDGLGPIELPEGYSMTHHDTTTEQALETMEYLTRTYASFLGFGEPAVIVSGDYDIYGRYNRGYEVYDASGDDLQDILNYAFCRASFGPDDDGRLSTIWLRDGLSLLEKIGDYPMIGIDEARERFIAGLYQTSVPYDMPGEEYIAKVELMYRNSRLEEVCLPYYRFFVELPDDENPNAQKLGLKTFGAYYVPAIASEYIGNAEIYHGQFN